MSIVPFLSTELEKESELSRAITVTATCRKTLASYRGCDFSSFRGVTQRKSIVSIQLSDAADRTNKSAQ